MQKEGCVPCDKAVFALTRSHPSCDEFALAPSFVLVLSVVAAYALLDSNVDGVFVGAGRIGRALPYDVRAAFVADGRRSLR